MPCATRCLTPQVMSSCIFSPHCRCRRSGTSCRSRSSRGSWAAARRSRGWRGTARRCRSPRCRAPTGRHAGRRPAAGPWPARPSAASGTRESPGRPTTCSGRLSSARAVALQLLAHLVLRRSFLRRAVEHEDLARLDVAGRGDDPALLVGRRRPDVHVLAGKRFRGTRSRPRTPGPSRTAHALVLVRVASRSSVRSEKTALPKSTRFRGPLSTSAPARWRRRAARGRSGRRPRPCS